MAPKVVKPDQFRRSEFAHVHFRLSLALPHGRARLDAGQDAARVD
jgi:hypothetical protein